MAFDDGDPVQHHLGLETLSGLRAGAIEHGYDLLMSLRPTPEWLAGREEATVLDKRCDAYLFALPKRRDKLLAALGASGTPAVALYATDVPPGVAWVGPDNALAMRLAVDRLHGAGHRRIAHLAGLPLLSEARERAAAFTAAMRAHGLDEWSERIVAADWNPRAPGAAAACDRVLDWKPTAVVCANDFLALGLIACAKDRELNVPGDLSLVGMDDVREAAERGLTTVRNPFYAIGRAAVGAAVAIIQGTPPDDACQRIALDLIERRSVRAI
ncbi:MAG: substrate-binding domain-containing protein [Planctomycetes bacterium]|nr:substrate-binding domain-containing protein [Planctomycetota bacterium]